MSTHGGRVARLLAAGLLSSLIAGGLASSGSTAAPAKGLTFAVKVPSAGGVSVLFVRLTGALTPGASLPAHLDLRQLAQVGNARALPTGLAVFAAARVGRSGSTVAIRELIVVLNPRVTATRKKASAGQEKPPVKTVTVKQPFTGSGGLTRLGLAMRYQMEVDEEKGSQAALDRLRQDAETAAENKRRDDALILKGILDNMKRVNRPDPVIAPAPPAVAEVNPADLGAYDDGHAFGWRVKGSPAGSTKGAAVVNDLDALITDLIRVVEQLRPGDEVFLESATHNLERDAAFRPGSLELDVGATTTTTTTTTTGSATTCPGSAKSGDMTVTNPQPGAPTGYNFPLVAIPSCAKSIAFKVIDASSGKELTHPAFPPSTDWTATYGSNPGHIGVIFGLNNTGTSSGGETKQVYALVSWN